MSSRPEIRETDGDAQHKRSNSDFGSENTEMGRRTFLKTVGVGAGTVAVGASGVGPVPSPVGESEAIGIIGAVAAVGAAAAIGWAIRETEVVGSDDVPDGISGTAILETSQQRAAERESVDSTLFTTTSNIAGYSRDTAFSKAKLAAYQAINNGKTEAEVETAALAAVDKIQTTTEKNFLNSWNESYRMAHQIRGTIKSSPEASLSQITFHGAEQSDNELYQSPGRQRDYTFPNGDTLVVEQCRYQRDNADYPQAMHWDALEVLQSDANSDNYAELRFTYGSGDTVTLLGSGWRDTWTQIQNTYQGVRDDVAVWITEAYSAVQQGQIDPSQLLDPAERARTYPDGEENAQAVADLAALNIPVDTETNVRIRITGRERNPEMTGILGCTDPTKGPFSAGDTINPSAETYTMTFRPSTYVADAPNINTSYGVQGGQIQWNGNPNMVNGQDVSGTMVYLVETAAGETARVAPGDFVKDANGIYTADIGDELSSITVDLNGAKVAFADGLKDEYMNEPVNETFEIVDASGEITFSQPYEPQTSTNYLTESEWQDQQDNIDDLIDEREQEKNDGGLPAIGDGLSGLGGSVRDLAILFGLAILGLFGLNAASG